MGKSTPSSGAQREPKGWRPSGLAYAPVAIEPRPQFALFMTVVFVCYVSVMHDFYGMMACDVQRFVKDNKWWLRHVALFGVMLFVRAPRDQPLHAIVLQAVGLYALVLMSTKCRMRTFAPAIAGAAAYALLELYQERVPEARRPGSWAARGKEAARLCTLAFIVGGFVMYLLAQRSDHGAKFRLAEFFFTTKSCRST